MRRLWVASGVLLSLAACKQPEGNLRAEITLERQGATCLGLEVRSGGERLDGVNIERKPDKALHTIGIRRGDLPETVTLRVTGYVSLAGGCTEPLVFNGAAPDVDATFPATDVFGVPITLGAPGIDGDGDGYLASAANGSDCNDADATVHPFAKEVCSGDGALVDADCNITAGCADPQCSSLMECVGAPVKVVITSPPVSVEQGVCTGALTLEVRTVDDQPATLTEPRTVSLDADGPTIDLHQDASCASPSTSLTILAGSSGRSFSFSAMMAGTGTLTARVSGLMPGTQAYEVKAVPRPSLALIQVPTQIPAGRCSTELQVEVRDPTGQPLPQTAPLSMVPSVTPSTMELFSSSNCLPAEKLTILAITDGGTRVPFFVKDARAGLHQLVVEAPNLNAANASLLVAPGEAKSLQFITPPQGIALNACSGPLTVGVVDEFGNTAVAAAPIAATVKLNPQPPDLRLFSDPACAGNDPTVTIDADAGLAAPFYARGETAAQVDVTVTAAMLSPDAVQPLSIGADPPTGLAFSPASMPVVAGDCAGPVWVQLIDGSMRPSNNRNATPLLVTLAAMPTELTVFADPACLTAATGVSIPSNASGQRYFFRSTRAGSYSVTANANGFAGAVRMETIRAAAPTRLTVIDGGAQTVPSTTCSAPITFESRDRYGNASAPGASVTAALGSTPAGVTFHSSTDCSQTSVLSSLSLAATTATVFAKAERARPYSLEVAAPFATGTTPFTVVAGPASALAITGLAASERAGVCVPGQVQLDDGHGNAAMMSAASSTVVTLDTSAPSQLRFFADASCGTERSTVTIAPGMTAAAFSVRGTRPENTTVRARAVGLTEGTAPLVVTLGPPHHLGFTTPPRAAKPNVCISNAIRLELQDEANNPITVGAPLAVSTDVAPDGGAVIWPNGGCGGTTPGPVTINSGASGTNLFFKGTVEGVYQLTANAPAPDGGMLLPATTQFVVAPMVPTLLQLNDATTGPYEAGDCRKLTVERREGGTAVSLPVATPLTLSSNAADAVQWFGNDATCTAPSVSASIPAGAASSDVFFKGISGGTNNNTRTVSMRVDSPDLSGENEDVGILPMVRRGRCDIANNQSTSPRCAVAGLTDASRTFLLFVAIDNFDRPEDAIASCSLVQNANNTVDVLCRRDGSSGPKLDIFWQTVSFARPAAMGGATVQHLSRDCDAGEPFPSMTAVNSVDPAQSFVLMSSHTAGGEANGDDFHSVELSSPTAVTLGPTAMAAVCGVRSHFELQVVQWAGADVSRGSTNSFTENAIEVPVSRDWSRSLPLHSVRFVDVPGEENLCRRRFRTEVTDAGTMRFTRTAGSPAPQCQPSSGGDVAALAWQVVQLPAQHRVFRVPLQWAPSVVYAAGNLPTPVDWTRAIGLTGSLGPNGNNGSEVSLSGPGKDLQGATNITIEPTSATLFGAYRGTNEGDAGTTVFVVEMQP